MTVVVGRSSAFVTLGVLPGFVVALYYLIASPPLHLVFPKLSVHNDPNNRRSIYVPGSGFSGFFFHLGYFSNRNTTEEERFYCYSSGCLSLLLSRTDLDAVFQYTNAIQDEMRDGTLSPYEVVARFVNQSIVHESKHCNNNGDCSPEAVWIRDLLPSLNILVTTWKDGVKALKPSTPEELADFLVQTTYIPFVTGPGEMLQVEEEHVLDGGFSRALHPKCDIAVHVPMTFDNLVHTLNPLMSKETARRLWQQGYEAAANTGSQHSPRGMFELSSSFTS